MNLNKNSWHAWLYKNSYKTLPQSLCPYFWKLLFALILLPITWIGYLLSPIRTEKSFFLYFLTTFITYITILGGYRVGQSLDYGAIVSTILGTIVTVVGIALAIGLIMLTIWGIVQLDEYKDRKDWEARFSGKPKKKYIVTEWYKAFKGKYCPKINWN